MYWIHIRLISSLNDGFKKYWELLLIVFEVLNVMYSIQLVFSVRLKVTVPLCAKICFIWTWNIVTVYAACECLHKSCRVEVNVLGKTSMLSTWIKQYHRTCFYKIQRLFLYAENSICSTSDGNYFIKLALMMYNSNMVSSGQIDLAAS